MGLELVALDHPVLRKQAVEVDDFGSSRLEKLANDMDQVRVDACGIGLAAPQVGISERVIIVEVPDEEMVGVTTSPGFPPTVLINPEIVWESEEYIKLPEGCLSIPGMMGNVSRPAAIQVVARDLDGSDIVMFADRWLARVLQHEIDHLDGILFVDRVEDPSELWYVERVDINDPIFSHNPSINEIKTGREQSEAKTGLA